MTLDAFIGLVMLLVLLGAIFIGVPISFTLLFLAFSFGYLGMGATVFDLAYFQTIGMMKEELLAAVPLFIFMGFITEQAGLMERLFTAFRLIIFPQALMRVLAPLTNQSIVLVKDTTLVSAITVMDLTLVGKLITERSAASDAFVVVAAFYLALTSILGLLHRVIEHRFAQRT